MAAKWGECPCCGEAVRLPIDVYDDFIVAYCKHCQQDQIIAGDGLWGDDNG